MANKLDPGFIEHIHDVLVTAFMPYDEKINPSEFRNRGLIESAAGRPFQTAFGAELWPTLPQKAAVLFHSLVCNHCFINGNKRTAVIGVDMFAAINRHLFIMPSHEVYEMARTTAQANQDGVKPDDLIVLLDSKLSQSLLDIEFFKREGMKDRLGEHYETVMKRIVMIEEVAAGAVEFGMAEASPIQT